MTTLADVQVNQQFPFVSQVQALDATAGITLGLFGSQHQQIATITIAPDGTVAGTMQIAPADVPVTIIQGFNLVAAGDILANDKTGETMVCRWAVTQNDGSVIWGASTDKQVSYSADGWTTVGHIDPNTLTTS